MIDESTYGFSKGDAESLLSKIELKDELTPKKPLTGRRRGTGSANPDISLRVSGLNFQINYNRGAGWETWATGEECP
jgi:hypothetical protein